MKKKLFATGMGGCVGHYLFDELKKRDDLELTFLIRSPEKVKYDLTGISIIKDEFKNIAKYKSVIKDMDYIIHVLPDWGGEEGNYQETLELFDCVDPVKVTKIIYFSTASILGPDNKTVPEVLTCGTPYIRGKYKMHEALIKLPHFNKTVVLFPTWVLGGDEKHPYSHAYSAIKGMKKWIRPLSFLTSDLRFHFIHAKDIAGMASHLLFSDEKAREYVMGTKAVTIGDFISAIAVRFGIKRRLRFNISQGFAGFIARVFDKKLTLWDKYCLKTFHQEFKTADPSYFGLVTSYPDIKSIVEDVFGELEESMLNCFPRD